MTPHKPRKRKGVGDTCRFFLFFPHVVLTYGGAEPGLQEWHLLLPHQALTKAQKLFGFSASEETSESGIEGPEDGISAFRCSVFFSLAT